QARAGYESDKFRLMLYDRQSKQTKDLLPKFDRWVDEFAWETDSKYIYLVSEDQGEARVYGVSPAGDDLRMVRFGGSYNSLISSPDNSRLIMAQARIR